MMTHTCRENKYKDEIYIGRGANEYLESNERNIKSLLHCKLKNKKEVAQEGDENILIKLTALDNEISLKITQLFYVLSHTLYHTVKELISFQCKE